MPDEIAIPNPEYFIKSIAEQGYSLETSVADLIDNSISAGAGKVEVLVDTQKTPFVLFIADDGGGMSPDELKKGMELPSSSVEASRSPNDLGRFGLGMKTASFAQTRCLTVISREKGTSRYQARTWDVEHLKSTGTWSLIPNTETEINTLLKSWQQLSQGFLNPFENYKPNTIVIWRGLYKYESGPEGIDNSEILQKELTEITREYMQLIFHRFLNRADPLKIRLNNEQLIPFDPFPDSARNISIQQKLLMGNNLRLEGFVLPNRSLEESNGASGWTLSHKSLMDMEGIYIYRADRLIVFGGWIGMIKKAPRLQLARLRVEIGNGIDHLFHLNVAKSSIIIPFGERVAFMRYVSILRKEAEKEYLNYETRSASVKSPVQHVFRKVPTSKGMSLEVDEDFPLMKALNDTLNGEQKKKLRLLLRMITTTVNKIRKVHEEVSYIDLTEKENLSEEDFSNTVKELLKNGMGKREILHNLMPALGISKESLPAALLNLLQ
ncbi:MAG: ATP-binding protein [Puia sp.]|nr:ATP-binding protein [Puia sp.]